RGERGGQAPLSLRCTGCAKSIGPSGIFQVQFRLASAVPFIHFGASSEPKAAAGGTVQQGLPEIARRHAEANGFKRRAVLSSSKEAQVVGPDDVGLDQVDRSHGHARARPAHSKWARAVE